MILQGGTRRGRVEKIKGLWEVREGRAEMPIKGGQYTERKENTRLFCTIF